MSTYKWGSSLYRTAWDAALAACQDWITGGGSARQAVINHLASYDSAEFVGEMIKAWSLDQPGGRDPNPDDEATSLMQDWSLDEDELVEIMDHAMAGLLRQLATEIAGAAA